MLTALSGSSTPRRSGGGLVWLSPDEKTREPFSADEEDAWQLAQEYDLCITGERWS